MFLFTYTVTDFTAREIGFDYVTIGSADFPGVPESAVIWWEGTFPSPHELSNAVAATWREDLSDTIVVNGVDWNGDGVVNSTDVSDFINDWFIDQENGTLVTGFNADGVSNSCDVSDFINAWFEAQPG